MFISKIHTKMVRLMSIIQKKHFTVVKRGPQVINKDKFRFDMFVLLIDE
jgi:putative transposase